MTLTSLIADYGYWAVFAGALLEGETVLLLAGFAAHRGMLRLPDVMLLAFFASTLADQGFFWIGRLYGARLLARFPGLSTQVPRVQRLLARFNAPLILSIRFLYGLRVAGPIAMGALHVPALKFALLNVIGAAVWAVLVAWLGYQFGNLLEWIMPDLKRVEEFVFVAILVAGVGYWWFRCSKSARARR